MEKIEKAKVEMTYISGAMVAQKMVEFVERDGNVLVATAIGDIQMFARMSVIEAQPVFLQGL